MCDVCTTGVQLLGIETKRPKIRTVMLSFGAYRRKAAEIAKAEMRPSCICGCGGSAILQCACTQAAHKLPTWPPRHRTLFEKSRGWRDTLPPILGNFAGGGLCSVGAWALIFPLDTVKSTIQVPPAQHAINTQSTCNQHPINMQSTCSQHAINMLSTCN